MEIYLGQDGSFYKIKRFPFEEISQKEIKELTYSHHINIREKSRAGSFGGKTSKPVVNFGARTGTSDDDGDRHHRSDILHDIWGIRYL
jgi:hypothetical protein